MLEDIMQRAMRSLALLCTLCLLLNLVAAAVAHGQTDEDLERNEKNRLLEQTYKKRLKAWRAERLRESVLLSTPRARQEREDEFAARVSDMSLREKVGQVFMVTFPGNVYSGDVADLVEKEKVGGVILYGISGNLGPARRLKRLTDELQGHATVDGDHLPLFVAVDQEGGTVSRLRDGFTQFPSAMALGATGDPDNADYEARIMATELLGVGVNVDFAPVADVNTNPENPVIGLRSFGSDPYLVAAFVRAFVESSRSEGLLCAAKHFPGHGEAAVDSHVGLPSLPFDAARLERVEFPPFIAAIAAKTPMIMTAHIALPKLNPEDPTLPATLSPAVLQGLLRGTLGYKGVIVTDSLFMGAVMKRFGPAEAAVKAFEAGADLLLFGADLYDRGEGEKTVGYEKAAMQALYDAVKSGRVSEKRLDASVERILRAKSRIAPRLLVPRDDRYALVSAGDDAGREAAEFMAGEAVTLVRNQGFLPLGETGGLAVIYPKKLDAVGKAFDSGLPWAKLVPVADDPTDDDVARAKATVKAAGGRALVVVSGVARHPAQEALVRALAAQKGAKIGVVAAGLPYDLLQFKEAPLLVATYGAHPGAFAALAAVCADEQRFTGHLPVSLPGLGDVGFAAPLRR
ncbi:glycoside hydrolase family 3 protein [Desulfovibrio sp. X2]|uniref:glycoside hydrolase family 3 protein n=1 Tax=Desulfovibrio sp. X2 TaxID=941449 RepID=UPI0004196FE3|nr:glycoside hydrolase family 3 protein [Desulfovibrio sp. X2]